MKTLILSVSAGHGHNAAGEAISEYILQQEPDSEIRMVDTLKYISPVLDKVLVGTYINSLKYYPRAFTFLYTALTKKDDSVLAIMEKMYELIAEKLMPLFQETRPEVIISTHPFTTHMLSVLKEHNQMNIPTIAVITDYGSHLLWVHPGIDYYVVAHESMVRELVDHGRDPKTVLPLGIPIRTSFKTPHDRRRTLAGIGLTDDLPTVTLMGGSLALGGIKTILEELDSIPKAFNIIVVAAQNEKLYDEAVEISLRSDKSIAVLKFCHFMDALLQATDLLVTKPGGLTVTESLNTGTPLAIFKAIGAQEEQNKQFLLRHDLAIDIGDGEDCAGPIEALLFHEDRLADMARRARAIAKPDSVEAIYLQLKRMVAQAQPFAAQALPQVEADEGMSDRFKSLMEDIREKLETHRMTARLMELVSGHDEDSADLDFYELSEDEMAHFLDEASSEEDPSPHK